MSTMAVSHHSLTELDASSTASASRSRSRTTDSDSDTTYATMTRQVSSNDTLRSPRGHLGYEVLTSNRAASRSTSSDASGSDDVERVMMGRIVVDEASESEDDDDDDDDDDHGTSDYVQFNPAKQLSPVPPSASAAFNDDCSTTRPPAGSEHVLRPRIQSASVLQSSHLSDEEMQVK